MKPKFDLNMTEEDEVYLWVKYRETHHRDYKDFFIVKYAPLVKYVAGKVAYNIPDSVEFEDLVGFGTFGLLDAIEKYDPSKGTKFKTYGITRIRGQIYDELRTLDWVPRSVRQKYKLVEEAKKQFAEKNNRAMTNEEIATTTGLNSSEIDKIRNMANDSSVGSLDDVWHVGSDDDEISILETIQAPQGLGPHVVAEKEEIRKIIANEIKNLPEKEQKVLILYYYEDLTLKEIGAVLDVTESRVSQLHTKAIQHIRNSLENIRKSLM